MLKITNAFNRMLTTNDEKAQNKTAIIEEVAVEEKEAVEINSPYPDLNDEGEWLQGIKTPKRFIKFITSPTAKTLIRELVGGSDKIELSIARSRKIAGYQFTLSDGKRKVTSETYKTKEDVMKDLRTFFTLFNIGITSIETIKQPL